MGKEVGKQRNRLRFDWLALLLFITLLAVPSSTTANISPMLKVQPLLLQLAVTQPDDRVQVIIRETGSTSALSTLVHRLGGEITLRLAFLNASVAVLPASSVPALAEAATVQYISLDGAMRPMAELAGTNQFAYADTNAINWTMAPKAAQSYQATNSTAFITWATTLGTVSSTEMSNAFYLIDEVGLGPDGYYAYHTNDSRAVVGGFVATAVPGHVISKVELVLPTFVNALFKPEVRIKTYVKGSKKGDVEIEDFIFQNVVGAANAGLVYLDITQTNTWRWSDFQNDLQIVLDVDDLSSANTIYYDAIGLRVTSVPGADNTIYEPTSLAITSKGALDTSRLVNPFPFVVRAPAVWNAAPAYLQGQAMTIAVVDSGIAKSGDLLGRNVKDVNFNRAYHDSKDRYGHGTFVASMVAGDGKQSGGAYLGIAPKSHLLNVRVSDDHGLAHESDVIAALEWIYTNKSRYNIRVVNLSLNASVATSYHLSPLNAAVELLWFNGIVVVVAAGNNGTAELFPPANDPFVITVGATDDRGTQSLADDVIGSFSAYGITLDGHTKPDLVAPGRNIVMYLPRNYKLTMGKNHPTHKVSNDYFRMSGTSLAAPIVAGAAALLLQDEPMLTPDQVKHRLLATANKNWPGYDPLRAGAGYLDIYAAVNGTTTASANTGITASQLLWPGSTTTWGSVSWNSVSWNSVSWNSVSWNSVSWNSVSWNSDHWDEEVVGAGAESSVEPLNAQGLPIPMNVGDGAANTKQNQNQRSFLPLVIQ
jgi:serine protease AprX